MIQPQVMPGQTMLGGPQAPPTGLIGREQALQGGLGAALSILGVGNGARPSGSNYTQQGVTSNRDMAIDRAQAGIRNLRGYSQPGIEATNSQAALSGAMGPEAQAQAYAQFQSSPGQDWLREQGERSVVNNAAAMGGLRGGNVMKELARYGQGLAAQDFQNSFNRMGTVADRGMQAAGLQTGLYGQQANAASAAGGQLGSLEASKMGADASRYGSFLNSQNALKISGANQASDIARMVAQGRTDAGNAIGGNYSDTASALSSLINQQGAGMADMYGTNMGNIANILTGAGRDQSASSQALAALLGNIATGSASQVAGLPGIPGVSQTQGILEGLGNAAAGFGSLMKPTG